MAREIESMAKELKLDSCHCWNVHNKKNIEMTEVILEFDSSNENWLRYSALKTEISILQKELDIKRLRDRSNSILENIENDYGYAICT